MNREEFKEEIEKELEKLSQKQIAKMANFACKQILSSAIRHTAEKKVPNNFVHDPYKEYINFLEHPQTAGFFYMHEDKSTREFWINLLAEVIHITEAIQFFIKRAKNQAKGELNVSIKDLLPEAPDYSMIKIPYFEFDKAMQA